MTNKTDPSGVPPPPPPAGSTDGSPSPAKRVVALASTVFGSLVGVVGLWTNFLDTGLQIVAAIVSTALAAVIVARVGVWATRGHEPRRNPRETDRWLAGIAVFAIVVITLDVVAFASDDTDGGTAGSVCMYEVSNAASAGAVSYPIKPGGSVTQTFVPTRETITAIVAIAGLNPADADLGTPHPLTMHLWAKDDSVDETVKLPDLRNNAGTRFDLSRPVHVDTEASYSFSVTNDSGHDDVGFYLKRVGLDETGVDRGSNVHIVGHRDMNPDYYKPGWAVSGCVEGLR
jgi:hypothetical protein